METSFFPLCRTAYQGIFASRGHRLPINRKAEFPAALLSAQIAVPPLQAATSPKSGDESRLLIGAGPQGDVLRIYNFARCVR